MRQHFGKRDWILLGVLAIIAIAIWGYTSFWQKESAEKAIVTLNGETYGTYDLKKDQTIEIKKNDSVCNVLCIQDVKSSQNCLSLFGYYI